MSARMTLCVLSAALVVATDLSAQTPVVRRMALNPGAAIKAFVPAGTARVIGWDRDSLVITGTVAQGEHFFFGGGRNGVKFGTESQTGRTESRASHLVIHVPRSSQVSVKGGNTVIEAVDVSGSFNIVGGSITVGGRAGEIEAEAMDGSVSITATARWVRARTASGTLRLTGDIEDAAAGSITGPVFISSSGIARGQFGSVTGDIVFTAPLREGGVFFFDNHSGAVELRLAPSAAGTFTASTVSGVIQNELLSARPTSGGAGQGESLTFRLGTGGSHVTIRTFKGAIRLRSRER